MVTAILTIVEMMLLKYLTKGGKSSPKKKEFGDKYNVTGKLFYM
jgi:hypothetical protein